MHILMTSFESHKDVSELTHNPYMHMVMNWPAVYAYGYEFSK